MNWAAAGGETERWALEGSPLVIERHALEITADRMSLGPCFDPFWQSVDASTTGGAISEVYEVLQPDGEGWRMLATFADLEGAKSYAERRGA